MPKRQMKIRRTISIGWSVPMLRNLKILSTLIFIVYDFSKRSYYLLFISLRPFILLEFENGSPVKLSQYPEEKR